MTWWCYGRRQICPQLFGYSAWNHAGFLGRPSQKTSPWKLRGAVVSRARFRIFGVPSNYRHDDGVEKRLWRPSARASPFMLCSASLRRRSADSEIRPDRALPQTASGQLVPLVTICLGGECRWLSSLPFTTKWWKGPGRLRWPPCRRFGVSGEYHHKKKAVQRTSEWETLGCRVAGTLGVMAPSPWRHQRPPRAHWVVLRCNSTQPQRVSDRREASCAFSHLWSAIYPNARPQKPTLEIVMDLLVVICLLPLLRFNMRHRVSPLIIATDTSESCFGVVRSSTLTLAGSDELSLRPLSTATACDQLVHHRAQRRDRRPPTISRAFGSSARCVCGFRRRSILLPGARDGVAHHSLAPASRRRAIQPHCSTRSIRISRHKMADWRDHPSAWAV